MLSLHKLVVLNQFTERKGGVVIVKLLMFLFNTFEVSVRGYHTLKFCVELLILHHFATP